jgi:hypothetical protein
MRTTITLDDDVAARLQAESRKSGRPFKVVVNDYLRTGLAQRRVVKTIPRFRVEPVSMGTPRQGHSYDDVGALLEELEGPERR